MDEQRLQKMEIVLQDYIFTMSTENWAIQSEKIIQELIIAIKDPGDENEQLHSLVDEIETENNGLHVELEKAKVYIEDLEDSY